MMSALRALVAEIGSTVTKVSAVESLDGAPARLVGRGWAPTTVAAGDVRTGLDAATADLEKRFGGPFSPDVFMASSSAAGGLRMSVHGLVRDMTVRAAREAALGAGANPVLVTAGRLRRDELDELNRIAPNILLLAGGVDYGERDTVLFNAELLAAEGPDCPVLYAGNIQVREEVRALFEAAGRTVAVVDNVYPSIDRLDVEPARRVIHDLFERHIVHAPGMEGIRSLVDGRILPTPGAVLEAARLLRELRDDLVVIDVGGATTDVHSVCEDSEEFSGLLLAPEPTARRTVEGDLGTYVSRRTLMAASDRRRLSRLSGMPEEALAAAVDALPPLPDRVREAALAGALAEEAARIALGRHAGRLRDLFGPRGKTRVAEGKDLSAVRLVLATGGALTRLPGREERLRRVLQTAPPDAMAPAADAATAFDDDYVMAAAGVLSDRYPEAARDLLTASLEES